MAEPRDSVIDSEVSFQPHTPNLFRSKFKKIPKKIIVIGVFIFILSTILTSLFLFKSNGTNKSVPRLFRLKSEESRNFPTVAKIEYDFKGLNHSYSYLKQHNEPLDWYMKNDTQVYQLPTFKGECIIYCDKPGLHHIELISNGKAIDTLRIPIRSKDWFGIAYSRSKKTPVDFIYTNRVDWEKLQSDNTKLGFKRKLSIPSTMLNTELCDIRYRSDYFYSGDIDIDGNELKTKNRK